MREAPEKLARFWSELKRARLTAGGKLLELVGDTNFVGWPRFEDKLIVRDCYRVLEDRLKSDFEQGARGRVVVGTPGVGLSMFCYYLLYKWACDNERVVLVKGNYLLESAFLLTSEGKAYQLDHRQLFQELQKRNTRYVSASVNGSSASIYGSWHMGPTVDAQVSARPRPHIKTGFPRGKLVLVTPPRRENYYSAIKAKGYCDYFMDTWTLEELQECRELMYSAVRTVDEVTELWTKYGGVARYIFSTKDNVELERLLQEAISCSSIDLIQRANTSWTLEPYHYDVLLHLRVKGEQSEARVGMEWPSPWVAEQVAEKAWRYEKAKLVEFVCVRWGLPYGTLRGELWKGLCHSRISAGGRFRVRDLEAEGCPVVEVELQPCTSRLLFNRLDEVVSVGQGTYCRPRLHSDPAVDSVIQPNMIFQIPVNEEHTIHAPFSVTKEHTIDAPALGHAVGCMNSDVVYLYHVVPEVLFRTMQKQRLVNGPGNRTVDVVRQYALEISYS